jgi:hypothetical protein
MFKTILLGITNEVDAHNIYFKISKHIENDEFQDELIRSLLYNHNFEESMSYEEFVIQLNILLDMNEITDSKLREIYKKTKNIFQVNLLKKIKDTKPDDFYNKNFNQKSTIKITKKCPHCSRNVRNYIDARYTVCGFYPPVKDSDGCGCEFCFRCNKILCKNWATNKLYEPKNRIHNNRCCKEHSYKTKWNYPKDYCQCNIDDVKRA